MDVDVLVIGSANRDLVVNVSRLPGPGETVLAGATLVADGGKGANQAVAAASAGARTAFVGAVGDDLIGRELRAELSRSGVDVSELQTVVGVPSGTAYITVDESGENTIVVAQGANAHVNLDSRRDNLHTTVVLAQAEIPAATVEAAAEFAARRGFRFVLNAAPAPTRVSALPGGADPLLVNQHEAAQLSATPDDPRAAARRLLSSARARSVVVTMGLAGSLIATTDDITLVPAARAEVVVDTTGAGDVFAGTLAAHLSRSASLVEAATAASAAAARSVAHHGARPPGPHAPSRG